MLERLQVDPREVAHCFREICARTSQDDAGLRLRNLLKDDRAVRALSHEPGRVAVCGVRLRTAAAKRYEKVDNATAVMLKTLLIAERTFRRLELLAEIAEGVTYVNGERVKPSPFTHL